MPSLTRALSLGRSAPGDTVWRRLARRALTLLRTRHWRWLVLLAPTLLSTFYFVVLAAEQYESEARFVVRSASRPNVPGALGFLVQLGIARSQDDSFIVQEYMTSRDAISRLQAMMPLRDMYKGQEADVVAHYPSPLFGPENEEFHRYFQRMVSVVHADKTGISTLKVRAFAAADAHRIAAALLGQAEELVNRLNERSQQDSIRSAVTEVQVAQTRLVPVDRAGCSARAMPRRIDQHEPRLVVGVGPHEVVVRCAHVDGRVVDRTRATTEHCVELGVVLGREPHVVVAQPRGTTAHGQQQYETRQ